MPRNEVRTFAVVVAGVLYFPLRQYLLERLFEPRRVDAQQQQNKSRRYRGQGQVDRKQDQPFRKHAGHGPDPAKTTGCQGQV